MVMNLVKDSWLEVFLGAGLELKLGGGMLLINWNVAKVNF